MKLNLEGKVALITGSSKGIGKTIAESLSNEGCNVILNGRNKSTLIKTSREIKNSSYFLGDVTDFQVCKDLIKFVLKTHKKLDILICNVGSGNSVQPGKENPDEIQRMITVNLFSAINTIHAAKESLKKSKGAIVCISSIAGVEEIGAPIGYSVAKTALNSYVNGISRYLGRDGIRVNIVSPGNIIFKGSVWEKKSKKNPSEVKKILKNVPLNRLGKPKEIADLVLMLVSSRASFVTGTNIVSDGGQVRALI